MPTGSAGRFAITYTLYTSASDPDADIQFGMDFTLTQTLQPVLPLCQLIFPATAVGTNLPGQWNVDNHRPASADPISLIFNGAENGVIKDTPREISRRGQGTKATKFAVFRVDLDKKTIYTRGVSFGYSIDTSAQNPATVFDGIKEFDMDHLQKAVVTTQCPGIKFG